MPDLTPVAKGLFVADWPNDTWESHVRDGKPDAAARRYLMLAEVAWTLIERVCPSEQAA